MTVYPGSYAKRLCVLLFAIVVTITAVTVAIASTAPA